MPAQLSAIVIDCADPAKLSAFYREVTGWKVGYADDDFVYLGEGPVQLAFQRVPGYVGPGWPDDAKHAHLDLQVPDVEKAAGELVALGATRPDFQPGDGKWVVLADPEGHVFCLTPAE
ncbi:VOC family protein [Lentzea tibetensis]|uniref:VOC family protein n=1 Tax=Lentzea tibetensis TaxID=2591470 RepID=A0A563EWD2_9PSEU|nr:VOC family protein [Lentzea tibetensis]TWP52010.1 VOC family protein [Lentzea tibetensis]